MARKELKFDPETSIRKAKLFAEVEKGMPIAKAANIIGVPKKVAKDWMREDDWLRQKVNVAKNNRAERARINREKVEDIILEAVDIARIKAESGDMIRGASELGKLNGLYAPAEKKVTIEGSVDVNQVAELSDEELLKLTEQELDPIEAEFERIENDGS